MIDRKQAPSFMPIKEGACFLSYLRLSEDAFTYSVFLLIGVGSRGLSQGG